MRLIHLTCLISPSCYMYQTGKEFHSFFLFFFGGDVFWAARLARLPRWGGRISSAWHKDNDIARQRLGKILIYPVQSCYGYHTSSKTPGIWTKKNSLNKFHLGCWWFLGKIFRKKERPTPQIITGRQVQSQHRLWRKNVHWNINILGLWKMNGTNIHARTCMCSTPLISTQKNQNNQNIHHTPVPSLYM